MVLILMAASGECGRTHSGLASRLPSLVSAQIRDRCPRGDLAAVRLRWRTSLEHTGRSMLNVVREIYE
jgi:hypothetical protein